MTFRGILVAEGEYEKTVEFSTAVEFDSYAAGVRDGANLYGSGSCSVYTLDDLPDLDSGGENDRIIAALVRQYLEVAP